MITKWKILLTAIIQTIMSSCNLNQDFLDEESLQFTVHAVSIQSD